LESALDNPSGSEIPGNVRTPSSHAAKTEQRHALRSAINSLPERYRTVLRLYKLEELSLGDVATSLKLTKNATARLLERALSELRRRLERG
jgi:RNA polymerase sigma-70 factor (ECF subfamily)